MASAADLADALLEACSSDICDWSQARSLAAEAAWDAATVPAAKLDLLSDSNRKIARQVSNLSQKYS